MPKEDIASTEVTELKATAASTIQIGIYQITVKSLFGYLDYTMPKDPDARVDPKVFILYGENGCGKTTILELAFHLLSPATNRGHRSAIERVPFRTFQIILTNGTVVRASRTPDNLTGRYSLIVEHQGDLIVDCVFDAEAQPQFSPPESRKHFLEALEGLGHTIYLLSADRSINVDLWSRGEMLTRVRRPQRSYRSPDEATPEGVTEKTPKSGQDVALEFALRQAHDWIRRHAVRSNNLGTGSANTIYAEIIKRITKFGRDGPREEAELFEDLTGTLDNLSAKAKDLAQFRLTPPLNVDDIRAALEQKQPDSAGAIGAVLEAFIDTTAARFKALESIYRLTSTFVENLNWFYSGSGKRMAYDVVDGFAITSPIGKTLYPAWLSSGEKHLLMLFCHVLTARDKPSIFIIDEPELSLNVKWQRQLIDSLLDIVTGTGVQFVLATHSLELLSQHFDSVIELTPTILSSDQQRGT